MSRLRVMAGVQSVPRVMRGAPVIRQSMFDVPLVERKLGDDIEMPEECMRAGEVLLSPGVCGPDPRQPMDPYATPPTTTIISPGTRISVTSPVAASASGLFGSMSKATMLVAAVGAIGLIYYLGKKR